jgi:hypothetical protein
VTGPSARALEVAREIAGKVEAWASSRAGGPASPLNLEERPGWLQHLRACARCAAWWVMAPDRWPVHDAPCEPCVDGLLAMILDPVGLPGVALRFVT